MSRSFVLVLLCVTIFTIVGCSGVPLKISNQLDNNKYEVIGESEASCTGIMLFQLIPINQNERFRCAYDKAVARKGGDALIDVEIKENWFWAWVLNGYKTHVKGTVIKFKK